MPGYAGSRSGWESKPGAGETGTCFSEHVRAPAMKATLLPSLRHAGPSAPRFSRPTELMMRSPASTVLDGFTSAAAPPYHRYAPEMATASCDVLPRSATFVKVTVLLPAGGKIGRASCRGTGGLEVVGGGS